jgi:PPE-repeat protein
MDFGIYPPEINSGRMYAGPGSGPMLAAAQAWGGLADEMYTAATAYQSVVSELTSGSWSGPSSTAMAAAASSYVTWLSSTAAQAEQTAAQAAAAATAYEGAFASTVPPPEIAANRSLLMALLATNFFGQNTPAIAATEAQYAEMWAQDAAAMYVYAGSSAAASALTPFRSPDQNTDPGSSADQAAAVSQASGTSAGNAQSTVSTVAQAVSAATTSTPAQSSLLDTLGDVANLLSVFVGLPSQTAFFAGVLPTDFVGSFADLPVDYISTVSGEGTDQTFSEFNGEVPWPGTGPAPVGEFPAPLANLPAGTIPAPEASAAVGEANAVGGLSVPSSWTVAAPEIRSVAMASPLTNAGPTAAAPLEVGSSNMFNQLGLAGMSGQAMAGPPSPGAAQQSEKAVTHARLTPRFGLGTTPGDRAADAEVVQAPRTVVTGVAAAIRDIARQRDEGRLSEQEYTEEKKRLLEFSIRHRPLG